MEKNLPVRKRKYIYPFLLSIGFLIASCSNRDVYVGFQHIDRGRWYQDSTFVFRMDSLKIDPGKRYDVTVELSSNSRYPYRNLAIAVENNFRDTLFQTDTLHILLADEQGRWLGNGVGGLFQLSAPFLHTLSFDAVRSYEVRIRHNMEADPLPGIEKLGIRIMESREIAR